jgi:hypothetical protein
MKKVLLNLVFIFTSIFSVAQTELQNAREKPLNETEIKNSYVFKNNEDKHKSSELIKSIPVTDYDLTKVFLSEIEKVLVSANNLKINVKDSEELETLNKSIYFLKNLQYNITSTNDIVYYKAIIKHTNYSNLETIDTINVEPIIAYYGKVGGYEKNRLKWLQNARENITTLNHLSERDKFKKICSDVKYIQEKENYRIINEEIKKTKERESEIPTFNETDIQVQPEFPGGIIGFRRYIAKNFRFPDDENLKGKVIVKFIVEIDGSLTDINVVSHIGYGTDKEAIRVLKSSPKWIAGQINGKNVRCNYQIPINIDTVGNE